MKTLCDLEQIKKLGMIDKNLLNNISEHLLHMTEIQVLQPVLTKHLYQQMLIQKTEGKFLPQYKELLEEYIYYAVANRLKSELIYENTYQLKRTGVQGNSPDKTSTLSMSDIKEICKHHTITSNWWLEQMVTHIESNLSIYPEYNVVTKPEDVIKPKDKLKCPLVL